MEEVIIGAGLVALVVELLVVAPVEEIALTTSYNSHNLNLAITRVQPNKLMNANITYNLL